MASPPTPTIGFRGGMALLISSITGPGLTTIPLLFQQAGWVTPTLSFIIFGAISYVVSLLLVETMSSVQGNESLEEQVEYSTIVQLYTGKVWHLLIQGLLYCALQSVNIASIIISVQTVDSILIRIFKTTCGVSLSRGWICVTQIQASGSPFDDYILFSFGYLVSAALVLPLSMMTLVKNIKVQIASAATLFFVIGAWIVIFKRAGLSEPISAVGHNHKNLIGFVLNNFAFITTIPSFINELNRKVSIHKVVGFSIILCVAIYLVVGLIGAASKALGPSDIVAALASLNRDTVIITVINTVFPVAVLITSVPVFAIVIRYNLVRGKIFSKKWALLWASFMPWILIIPFQTKGWLLLVMNWSSLIFGSSTNFIIPLILYLYTRTRVAKVPAKSSSTDELEVVDQTDSEICPPQIDNSDKESKSRSRVDELDNAENGQAELADATGQMSEITETIRFETFTERTWLRKQSVAWVALAGTALVTLGSIVFGAIDVAKGRVGKFN